MSQRLGSTKYLYYLLVLYAGASWNPVLGVTVKTPPKIPSTIEAQAKFFQDFFSVQLSPYKIEFGHVCEDPNTWEQRYEKKDFKNHRDMGKVRWGDKKGGYGEHYWDLNHAGHAGDHDDNGHYNDHSDDGSYRHDDDNHGYDGSNEHSSPYTDDYDPEKASYEESGRAKRAHPRIKQEKKPKQEAHYDEESNTPKPKSRRFKEQLQEAPSQSVENYTAENDDSEPDEEAYRKPNRQYRRQQKEGQDNLKPKEAKNQVVPVVNDKDRKKQEQNAHPTQDYSQFVPYEGGAGVRQHYQPEVTAAASVPRLFLEPTTGHVVDRATGQAYVLQPIAATNPYN